MFACRNGMPRYIAFIVRDEETTQLLISRVGLQLSGSRFLFGWHDDRIERTLALSNCAGDNSCNYTNAVEDSAMPATRIEVKRIAGALGAEVFGVDLSQPLDDATVAEIRRAWL